MFEIGELAQFRLSNGIKIKGSILVKGRALRADHTEAVAGRCLHHDPALDTGDDGRAERFQPGHFGFLVVGFDVHVDAGDVVDRLHQHFQRALIRDLGVFAFLVDLDIAAQGCTPEAGGLGHMVGLAVDDDAAQSCAMCHAYTLSMMRSPNRPCGRKTRNISAST